jgi:hypothetical protein
VRLRRTRQGLLGGGGPPLPHRIAGAWEGTPAFSSCQIRANARFRRTRVACPESALPETASHPGTCPGSSPVGNIVRMRGVERTAARKPPTRARASATQPWPLLLFRQVPHQGMGTLVYFFSRVK